MTPDERVNELFGRMLIMHMERDLVLAAVRDAENGALSRAADIVLKAPNATVAFECIVALKHDEPVE